MGFDTLDFGSFVSPKAIPQLRDTAEVLEKLDLSTTTKLLAIVANLRGAMDALAFDQIDYLGFPLSVSETFQQRNTNKSIIEAIEIVRVIQDECKKRDKELVVYLSMGFGNPYGDPYSTSIISDFIGKLNDMGIGIVSIADTVGAADPALIGNVLADSCKQYPDVEIGAHLHSAPQGVRPAVEAALKAGVTRIDGALLGYGGCPMAEDDLVGNVATEQIISLAKERNFDIAINNEALNEARVLASKLFGTYR